MAYDDIFEYDYKQTDCIPDEIISKHETGESDIDNVLHIAQKTYGITYLYPWQRMVIENILDTAQNAEKGNQIILLPTGAGKSLCFMVPALFLPGPTLILYPLLALMADQKRRLDESSISSVIFRGDQSAEERNDNFRKIKDGTKFILANPEVLQSESIMAKLGECNISHIVIDEAHCVSEWGDSFRPAYLTVGNIIKKLHPPAVSAFTATASAEVLNRISEVLFDGNAHILRSEADRANIHYYVRYAYAKKKILIDTVMAEKRPLIIFCSSRKRTKDIALMLQEFLHRQGEIDTVKFYHAGLSREEKSVVEQWFFPKGDAILVSTCAFGMGVDKKDIKTVIHFDAPSSAEAYIHMGYRIELSEIETVLHGLEGVSDVACLYHPERDKIIAVYAGDLEQREV
ncbi:MAG: RecQ family ATP-dependent DNA helicase, partial [Spirochaetales bacterium]